MPSTASPGHDPLADLAVATLRGFEQARETAPAYRAGAIERLVARLIDGGILLCLLLAAIVIDYRVRGPEEPQTGAGSGAESLIQEDPGDPWVVWGFTDAGPRAVIVMSSMAGLLITYELVTTALLGASPGKRLLGIGIVSAADRAPVGLRRLALRTALVAIPAAVGLLTGLGSLLYAWVARGAVIGMFAWLRWDPAARTLYDRWAGTQVVSTDVDGCEHIARSDEHG